MTLLPTTIGDALRAVVDARPDVIAVQDEETSLTYRELDLVTNHVAAELCDRTSPGAPIAIMAEHRVHTAVSMVATTKAGRISVIVDPREPTARIAQLSALAGCELLVAEDPVAGLELPHVHPASIHGERSEPPAVPISPDDVAAVYYTSGTTGAPKGVTFTHANVVLRGQHRVSRAGFRPDDVYGVMVNLAFGYSSALYVSFFGGLTARLLDVPTLGVTAIRARLRDEPITIFGCVPIVLHTITEAVLASGAPIENVRMLETGGEALQGAEAMAFFEAFPNAEIRHLYGAAETGTIAQEVLTPGQPPPAGERRVWNVLPWQSVQLIADSGEPAATGASGEVVVTGPGVAHGYWRDEALTNEWFTWMPDGTRRVRTGDFATFTDDGLLVLEGRRDDLVKVSGQRVDLEIVMRAISELPEVDDVVTIPNDRGHLVAYVVTAGDRRPSVRELRAALGEKLPEYMLPREFFLLEDMPRTPRGKFDRERLQAIRAEAAAKRAPYIAPASDTELRVAREFEAMLGVENIGLDDDFHELGGDSLAALELLEAINVEFSIEATDSLSLESAMHSAATVRELARAIDAAGAGATVDRSSDAVMLPDGTTVLRLGTNDDAGPRLFLVPGAGEGTVRFMPLAHELARCTVFTFQRRGYQTRERPDRTVEELAARLVDAMVSVQPDGPYLVGGYSFGCAVAYEMAQQLRARHQPVALVVLLDPLQPSGDRRRWRRVRRARSRVFRFALGKPSASRVARARELADQARELAAAYRPHPYDGHVLVVETAGPRAPDDEPRWNPPLTGPVDRASVSGSHLAMLGPPNAPTLAATIDALIERVLDPERSGAGAGGDVGERDNPSLGPVGRG